MKKLTILAASGLAVILIAAGCAKPQSTPTTSAPVTLANPTRPSATTTLPPQTVSGPYGELRMVVGSLNEEQFDPIKGTVANASNILAPIYDFLVRLSGPGTAPGVADKWEIFGDGLSWNFYIHKGIKFHNGDPLTAADVKFSLERYMSKDAFASDLSRLVSRVEQVDDYTVRVYTQGPQPNLPLNVAMVYTPGQGQVMPKSYIEKNGVDYFVKHPNGSGPFKLTRYVPSDMIQYEAINNHWRQTPAFKTLTLIKMPDESSRVAALQTGEADIVDISIDSAAGLDAAGFKTQAMAGEEVQVVIHGAFSPRGANMPIADIKVRKALSMAINRDEIAKSFFMGKATPTLPSTLSEINTDIDVPYWKDYAAKLYKYDLDGSKQLLKDAGYANGFKITLFGLTGADASPYVLRLSEIIQGYWLKVGVQASIKPTDFAAWKSIRQELKTPDSEVIGNATIYTASRRPTTDSRLQSWYHTQGILALLNNKFPDMDKLIDASYRMTDLKERRDAFAKIIQTTADTYVTFGLFSVPYMVAIGPKIDVDLSTGTAGTFPPLYADIIKHKK